MIRDLKSVHSSKQQNETSELPTTVQSFHSEGGDEYIGSKLRAWFKQHEIKHEITTPYSPESNGQTEKLNWTLIDMARTAVVGAPNSVSKALRAEAVSHANYVRNPLPTRSSEVAKTPHEIIHGRQPTVLLIRIFGCTAFVHIPKQLRTGKFDERAEKGLFLVLTWVMNCAFY